MSELQWLERMQRVLQYVMTHAQWTSSQAKEGVSHRGVALLPGFGEVALFRLDDGQEVLDETTLATLLAYIGYDRHHQEAEEDTVET